MPQLCRLNLSLAVVIALLISPISSFSQNTPLGDDTKRPLPVQSSIYTNRASTPALPVKNLGIIEVPQPPAFEVLKNDKTKHVLLEHILTILTQLPPTQRQAAIEQIGDNADDRLFSVLIYIATHDNSPMIRLSLIHI